jgi:hypothetical protein
LREKELRIAPVQAVILRPGHGRADVRRRDRHGHRLSANRHRVCGLTNPKARSVGLCLSTLEHGLFPFSFAPHLPDDEDPPHIRVLGEDLNQRGGLGRCVPRPDYCCGDGGKKDREGDYVPRRRQKPTPPLDLRRPVRSRGGYAEKADNSNHVRAQSDKAEPRPSEVITGQCLVGEMRHARDHKAGNADGGDSRQRSVAGHGDILSRPRCPQLRCPRASRRRSVTNQIK